MTEPTTPSRRAGLRDEIAAALEAADYRMDMRRGDLADAVLPVLYQEWPWLRAEAEDAAPVGRAAVLAEAAEARPLDQGAKAEALLLRFTAEAHRRKWDYDRGVDDDGQPVKSEAFDALHRLGEEMRVELEKLRRMAVEAQPSPDLAAADDPTPLRWGLNDVMWGDDDTVTVLLSGPDGEPYWLELDPERAAVLREDLAGPDGDAQSAEVVHACPPDGSGLTPCCGRTPFELPLTDRISSEAPVTCPGAQS